MSLNFLLESIKLLHNGNYSDNDLLTIYNFLVSFDNKNLKDYFNRTSILSYNDDLELYIEVVNILIKIFENKEEYEKCQYLKNKEIESLDIISKQIVKKHEYLENE